MRTIIRLARDLKIQFAVPNGVPLYLDVVRPEGAVNLPVILVVHGGGWCLFDRKTTGAIPPIFARAGYVAVNIDYRLAPLHMYPAACEDLLTALTWIKEHIAEYGGDPARIGGIGFSAGGHLLGLLAMQQSASFAGIVSWGGPMDMRHEPVTASGRGFVLGFLGACQHDDPALYAGASPINYVTPLAPPFLFIHGELDEAVPTHQSFQMAEALQQAGVDAEVMLLPGAGHTPESPQLPVMQAAWERILAFCHTHLQGE